MPTKPYKKGIEQIPIREIITTFPIIVFVIRLEDDDVVDQIEFDYSKIEDKKHLGRLTAWALMNGHYLEIMNKKDVDQPFVKENR